MNWHGQQKLDNALLRRVQRHKSMTILFNEGNKPPGKQLAGPSVSSVIQARLEGSAQSPEKDHEAASAFPVIPSVPATNTRQAVSPSASGANDRQTQSGALLSLESAKQADASEQRLETIFRKHQDLPEAKSYNAQAVASSDTNSVEPVVHDTEKEKEQPGVMSRVLQGMEMIFRKRQEPAEKKALDAPAEIPPETEAVEPAGQPATKENRSSGTKGPVLQSMKKIFRKLQKPAEAVTTNAPDLEQLSERPSVEMFSHNTGQRSEPSKPQDPEWQRLQTIFNKHEEKKIRDEANTDSNVDLVPPVTKPVEPIQRSIENAANKSNPVSPKRSMKEKHSQSTPDGQKAPSIRPKPDNYQARNISADEVSETRVQPHGTDHSPQQPIPLQSVWNVQRLNAPEIDTHQSFTPPRVAHHSLLSNEPDPDEELDMETEPVVFREEEKRTNEINFFQPTGISDSAKTPVEVLPPSRPRPIHASVMQSQSPIQRQPDNSNVIPESKESPLVNTVIGPMPSDLWTLIGQTPPQSPQQSKIGSETNAKFNTQKTLSDQPTVTKEGSLANDVSSPTVIQRQAQMNGSSLPIASQESDQVTKNEQPSRAEPDLDELAQRVYSEIRRRLSLELERMRGK